MFNKELVDEINLLYENYPEKKELLLKGDPTAINTMTKNIDIKLEDIVSAYENNKNKELYEEAKRRIEIKKLYLKLCRAYSKYHYNLIKEEENNSTQKITR